ncbi:hypothetical protein ACL02S_05760 [Nocardia sp. 004]|uniref:hypothetical protein n=1 Tax=Nocardia sp. 004 TaxID=3385978 RepID=UPI0039A22A60
MTCIYRLPVDVTTEWTDVLVPVDGRLVHARTEFGRLVTYWSHEGDSDTPVTEVCRVRIDSLPLAPGAGPEFVRGVSGLPGAVAFVVEERLLWVYQQPPDTDPDPGEGSVAGEELSEEPAAEGNG